MQSPPLSLRNSREVALKRQENIASQIGLVVSAASFVSRLSSKDKGEVQAGTCNFRLFKSFQNASGACKRRK